MELIASILRDAELPNFVTLTYPAKFPTVSRAKRDLKVFQQRLIRRFPGSGGIWKLEPQERGAPHYHLLIWGFQPLNYWAGFVKIGMTSPVTAIRCIYYFIWAFCRAQSPASKVRSWRGFGVMQQSISARPF